jgi:hypothetical protein
MSTTKVITPECVISYPWVFTPGKDPNGELKYSACLIFPKGTTVATETWGSKTKQMLATKQLRWPLRDGAEKATMGYGADKVFLSAKSTRQPGVVSKYAGQDGKPLAITDPDELYPGCKVRASLIPFAYDVNGNRGVSFLLGNIQKLGDGPRLDNRLRAEDEFEASEEAPTDFDNDTGVDADPMAA